MIRIIFDTGELIECEHIDKMYMEEVEMDKITIVGNIKALEENYVRIYNTVSEKEE